jgi:hypothetical protein
MRKWFPLIILGAALLGLGFSIVYYPYHLYVENTKQGNYYTSDLATIKALYAKDVKTAKDIKALDSKGEPLALTTWTDSSYYTLYLCSFSINYHYDGGKEVYYLLSFPDYWKYRKWLDQEAKKYITVGKYLGKAK